MVATAGQIGEPRLAPGGSAVAWLSARSGRGDVYVSELRDGRPQPPVCVTTEPTIKSSVGHGGGLIAWTSEGDSLVIAATDGALYEVSAQGGASKQVTPPDGYVVPCVTGDRIVCMRESPDAHDIAAFGRDWAVWPSHNSADADFCFDPVADAQGRIAWHEWDAPAMPWDAGRIMLAGAGCVVQVDGGDEVSVAQPQFSPDGGHLAYLSDRNGWSNVWIADLANDGLQPDTQRPLVDDDAEHGYPSWSPGNRSFAWSPDSARVAFVRVCGPSASLHVAELGSGETRTLDTGTGVWSEITWQGDFICGIYSGLNSPAQVRLVDPETGNQTPVSSPATSGFPAVAAHEVTWAGADGADVHGFLMRPEGVPDNEPGPMLVSVHGGPTSHASFGFNARAHYLCAQGWTVFFPNHRGSTGHGRAYAQALREGWGELDVDDIARGVGHLVESGVADRAQVAIMGASAGGLAVLGALVGYPDLYAAGVSLYGIGDLLGLAESTHRFEAHYTDSLVGALPDAHETYVERSPVTHAARIRTPLLLLHGDSDVVVPPGQSEAMARAVRAGGTPVEHHVYEGEGHGWGRPEVVFDELGRIDGFLRRHARRIEKNPEN